ncbi:MAG: HD domain-containing protein [Xenococcaceae cyanobacterium]
MNQTQTPLLTSRFEKALVYATHLHARQLRKGTKIPYISHLLSVAALVLENGGDETQAIAALLHDAIEDQGGERTRQEIRHQFGSEVAEIVEGCTDADVIPKPPWRERKQRYIAKFRHATPAVRRVSLADKLHNARSTEADYRKVGKAIWDRFQGGREGTLWFYRSIIKAAREAGDSSFLLSELERVVKNLESTKKQNNS